MNRLYYGDCLTIMREMAKYSVDLIYLDPPFNSNREYNQIYRDETGRPLPDQIEAFNDTWTLDAERERTIRRAAILLREAGMDDDTAELWRHWLNALRHTQPQLLAYLSYMVERLVYMKPLLKPTGAVYLHCDPTAAHYLKVLMDSIFGHRNFRNEIIWKRTSAHNSAKRFGPVHDTILFYALGSSHKWNRVYQEYDARYIQRAYRHTDRRGRYRVGDLTGAGTRKGESGKPWRGHDPTARGRHWAPPRKFPGAVKMPSGVLDALDYLDDHDRIAWPRKEGGFPSFKRYLKDMPGMVAQDIVTDIPAIGSNARERLGYRTQKPVALLERIIEASTDPGDTVLDPFCGCGTTMEAAQKLKRRWIGIDIAIHAVKRVARVRLEERLGLVQGEHFTIEGVPRNMEGARDLWKRDPYHFQKWAVEAVDGFVTTRRTGDGGVDGRIYFDVPDETNFQSMAIEVKGGHAGIKTLRELRGVLDDDRALLAGLIMLQDPTPRALANWRAYMARAGNLLVLGHDYPRMQLLTVREILDGKRFETPSVVGRGASQRDLGIA